MTSPPRMSRSILESLGYTKCDFQDYRDYPSYEFKQQRIADVERVIERVRVLRDRLITSD